MGRRAASIGAALGFGFTGGVSQKRRELAQEKRDRELAASAMNRIAQQHQNRLNAQNAQDAINDANRLQIQQEQDSIWRGVLEGRGINTKNLPGLINQAAAGVMLGELNRKEAADRAVDLAKSTQSANVALITMAANATSKTSPGGEKVTPGEKKAMVDAGGSLKQVKEAIDLVVGRPEKDLLQQELDVLFDIVVKQKDTIGQLTPEGERTMDRIQEIISEKFPGNQAVGFNAEILGEAISNYIEKNGGTEAQAYDVILSNMTPDQQQRALSIVSRETFAEKPEQNRDFIKTLSRIGGVVRRGGGAIGILKAAFGGRETRPLTEEEMAIGGFGQTSESLARALEQTTKLEKEPVSAGIKLLPPKKKKKEIEITPLGRVKNK